MSLMTINEDVRINGDLSAATQTLSASSVGDSQVKSNAAIVATKLQHRTEFNYKQANGTAIIAATGDPLTILYKAGTLVKVSACITGAIATGGDRTVNVDVQKGNAANAYATMLTGTIQFTNASALRTVSSATLASTTLAADDQLIIVVTVAGSASAQAQGLLVTVVVFQDGQ